MKFIKIFFASSIVEFEAERRQLGDFLRSLNDSYVKRGIYLELILCEDLDNALAMERKQQEYNQQIRNSQYFYILFGRKAGEYTVEEFDVALEQFRQKGAPRIFTYFLELPEDTPPEQLNAEFARLAAEYGKAPADAALLGRMMKLGEERGRVADALRQLENDMLGLYSQTAEKRQASRHLNWREKEALACVGRGDYEDAVQRIEQALQENFG